MEPCVSDGVFAPPVLVLSPQQARPTSRPVGAHEYPSRGLVESLVAPELLLPSCSVVAVASLRLLQALPFVEASLPRECVRTSLAHLAVGVLTCRLARDTGILSPLRCLAESDVAGLTGCPPRPGSCPSRC